ncbi:MAG TPA: histidine kinase [Anaerolineae bacterium]|nr:histidine kinase [Anaerolineae bacterium]
MVTHPIFLWSPPAVGFSPILLLHLSILFYLLSLKRKSNATWLFTGWMACLTLVAVSKLLGYGLYDLRGGYVNWIGGMVGSLAGLVCLLQFVYRFPRLHFPREARGALWVSLGATAGILALLVYEVITPPVYPLYDFQQFLYGVIHSRYARALTSVNIFGVLHPSGYLWAFLVCLRQVAQSAKADQCGLLSALWRPPNREARAARAFALALLIVFLPVITSTLESERLLPVGSLTVTYLLAQFALVVTHLNHSPEPSSVLVKLVGIVLVALLLVLGVANLIILNLHRAAYDQTRQAELAHIQTLIQSDRLETTPAMDEALADVRYIAARPAAGGVFPATYRMLFSRQADLTAQRLLDQEDFFKRALVQPVVQLAVAHENPWIKSQDVYATINDPDAMPLGGLAYRGVYADPDHQIIRYTFRLDETLYEVGYSYRAYRQMLHQKALPLVVGTVTVALLTPLVLLLFFRVNLLDPLRDLLRGVTQINAGDLNTTVPVRVEDEIGFLAHSFNGMVGSLQTLTTSLRQEIAERRRAEAEVRALNVTLERRVTDRTRELSALYQVSAVTGQDLALPTLLTELLARTMAAVSGEGGGAYLLEGATLRLLAQQAIPPEAVRRLQSLPANDTLVSWVIAQREPLLIPNVRDDPRTPGVLREAGALTLILLPLQAGGQVEGLLGLVRQAGKTFNLEEIALLSSIADQMGQAIENDRLHQQARQVSVLEERERIARALHDSVTQSLYGLTTLTEAGQAQLESGAGDAVARTLARIGETIRQALREMRLFIHQLRPPELEEEGLIGALHQRLAAVEGRANIQARLLVDETVPASLPASVQEACYRIANEALNNALRHARATEVTLTLREAAGQLRMAIVDNGCGFDPHAQDAGGMGLRNMEAYAAQIGAELHITSAPGTGTCIEIALSL